MCGCVSAGDQAASDVKNETLFSSLINLSRKYKKSVAVNARTQARATGRWKADYRGKTDGKFPALGNMAAFCFETEGENCMWGLYWIYEPLPRYTSSAGTRLCKMLSCNKLLKTTEECRLTLSPLLSFSSRGECSSVHHCYKCKLFWRKVGVPPFLPRWAPAMSGKYRWKTTNRKDGPRWQIGNIPRYDFAHTTLQDKFVFQVKRSLGHSFNNTSKYNL